VQIYKHVLKTTLSLVYRDSRDTNIGHSSANCENDSWRHNKRPLCQTRSELLATFTQTTKPLLITRWLWVRTIQRCVRNVLQI